MKNIIGNLRSECIRLFSKSTFIICIVLYILAIIAILITDYEIFSLQNKTMEC